MSSCQKGQSEIEGSESVVIEVWEEQALDFPHYNVLTTLEAEKGF